MTTTCLTSKIRLEETASLNFGSKKNHHKIFEDAVDFLTYKGESAILSKWIMQYLTANAKIQEPNISKPIVSIIIPCHNYGKYLTECINSILVQTYTSWEAIIINDGSTDNTHEVALNLIKKHPNHPIRYIMQECHGIVQPRNRGVTLARGEFILPLDADDIIAPEFLNKTVSTLLKHPEFGYVSTKALFFGTINSIWPSEPFNWINQLVTNQQTNSTLYRKLMWKDIGGYSEKMIHGYMDWEFWIRATKNGWIGTQISEPLFFYRRKIDSVVMRAKSKDICIKEQIIKLHPDIYDTTKIVQVKDEMCRQNWIPASLIRNDFRIKGISNKAEKILLNLLEQLLPSMKALFSKPEAGTGDPSVFRDLSSRLSKKSEEFLERGEPERAIEFAASLLALFPTNTTAAALTIQTLKRGSKIQEAYSLAKHYQALFPTDRALRAITANLLQTLAILTSNSARSIALLDAACMLSPDTKDLWAELASLASEKGQLRTAKCALAMIRDKPATTTSETSSIWYVTDTFGFGAGGVNGVTQAKFMTLSSIIRGINGPNVTVITKWHPDLPEALAEFSMFSEHVCGDDGFRWPLWIALEQGQEPSQNPRWHYSENPQLIIEEGVLLEGHRFLNDLPNIPTCPKAFIHHTSPQQYTGDFEYKNILDEGLIAFSQYDHHVCVSSNVIHDWTKIDTLSQKKWTHIPNCAPEEDANRLLEIDKHTLRNSLGLSNDSIIYICLASVQTRKGHDILLEQMKTVVSEVKNAQLLCIGPIHEEWSGQDIVKYSRKHFDLNQVRFLGVRRNALEYIRACDCLVLPSREEALPLVILEAMALNKPCIASNVNGIPELVQHGITGLLFSLKNQNDLALHMITLANNPELAHSMGSNAGKRYKELFQRKLHASRWKKFIESIIIA
jgi:glycosyltransferase involved in cell wall biosynthesis